MHQTNHKKTNGRKEWKPQVTNGVLDANVILKWIHWLDENDNKRVMFHPKGYY